MSNTTTTPNTGDEFIELDQYDFDSYVRSYEGKLNLSRKVVKQNLPASTRRQLYRELIEKNTLKGEKDKV